MFSQMCEAVAVCHDAGVSHRDIKPENFICCDSIELENAAEGDVDFGPQAKRKVVVKLTDFGLATTDEESGDVECGSKPYMSYECRNNLGPTYYPPAADVWSLGIVLINMLFHRNPWKDPTEGDVNFDNFLGDPTGFLLSKFTGIGREVATYLSCHVLCTEVEDRVTARDLGRWVKSLPEMIGGRKAVRDLKMARLETRNERPADKSLFAKSPVHTHTDVFQKASASALTSSAPMLSQMPPPSNLSNQPSAFVAPQVVEVEADGDVDADEMKSATTVDEQPTPVDTDPLSSPGGSSAIDKDIDDGLDPDADTLSLSTHKRRKRGVRKGKAAQAALAAAAAGAAPSQEEKDAMLKELAQASQSLARHLSKTSRPTSAFDATDTLSFPPLGTTPSQAAAAKSSKWKDMMRLTSDNPELAALARRVAERKEENFGTWSAPAKMQHSSGSSRTKSSTTHSSSAVTSSSTADPASTAASSTSGRYNEDDWRAKAAEAKKLREKKEQAKKGEDKERAQKAQLAAKALLPEPMGAFGANRPVGGNPGHPRSGPTHPTRPPAATANTHSFTSHRLQTIDDEDKAGNDQYSPALAQKIPIKPERNGQSEAKVSVETASAKRTNSSLDSTLSTVSSEPPHRPKLKGQIQSLAKMLSGLKTKGKD
jgi:serine/threonine protein kinase